MDDVRHNDLLLYPQRSESGEPAVKFSHNFSRADKSRETAVFQQREFSSFQINRENGKGNEGMNCQ